MFPLRRRPHRSLADVGFDPANAEQFFGTGIGLATVRRAVTRLGGSCWSDGKSGQGVQVYFSFGEPG